MFIKLLGFYIAYSYLVHLWAKKKVNLIQQPNTKQHSLFYEQWKPYFNKTQENIEFYPGTYTFLQRNWVNHEEARIFCIEKFTIQWFLFRLEGRGKVTFAPNNTVTLYEKYRQFGLIPLHIFWYGLLKDNTIEWKETEFVSPFKVVKNPKVAQELSQYSWSIQNFNKDYVVFRKNIDNKQQKLLYGNNFLLKPKIKQRLLKTF